MIGAILAVAVVVLLALPFVIAGLVLLSRIDDALCRVDTRLEVLARVEHARYSREARLLGELDEADPDQERTA